MLGDNMYGGESARDFQRKFEIPYKPVLDKGVKFYAALGNHDSTNQRMYKLFNMNGERFYTFRPKAGIRFFALDSNYMDRTQLQWLEKELAASGSDWKIMYFHHPIYSSGGRARLGHGAARSARAAVPQIRRGRRARRPRAFLRTAEAAEGHPLLHLRRRRKAAQRVTSAASSRRRPSTGLSFHDLRDRRRPDAFPDHLRPRRKRSIPASSRGAGVDDKAAPSVPAAPSVETRAAAGQAGASTAKPAAPSTAKPAAPATAKPAPTKP